jgi:hypothetical protein
MITQTRLYNKSLLLENTWLKPTKGYSFVEQSVKDGVDGIIVSYSNDITDTVRQMNKSLIAMELSDDNAKNNEELSK